MKTIKTHIYKYKYYVCAHCKNIHIHMYISKIVTTCICSIYIDIMPEITVKSHIY